METSTKRSSRKTVDPKTKCSNNNIQQPENRWVWILKNEQTNATSDEEECNYEIIKLRHPRSGAGVAFLYSHNDNTIQEILTCEDKKRSWFIGESVKSEGGLKFSTPVDPLFLVIPYLRKLCVTQAIPLDQLLCDEEYPKTELLLKCNSLKTLSLVADKKGTEDLQAYKFNEEKTLSWLQIKTEKVSAVLEKKGIVTANGIASSIFSKSTRRDNANSDNLACLRYAHEIVSEYIDSDLSQTLLHRLKLFEEPVVSLKRKSSSAGNETKKAKVDSDENVDSNVIDVKPTEVKPVKQTSKQKSRAKAATGNKSITSFFKKA